jgi:hypothetical protein
VQPRQRAGHIHQIVPRPDPRETPSTQPQTCSEHARFSLTDCLHFSSKLWRRQCSPTPTPLDPPGASIMTACVRAAAAYALSVTVVRVATPAPFAGFAIQADIAIQAHRAHAARCAPYAQSAFQADHADCARLALIAKDARSAKFASSANRANPAAGKATARPDLQRRRLRHRIGLPRHHPSVCHQPAIFSLPPTNAPAPHLLSPPSRPRAQATSTLNHRQLHLRWRRLLDGENVSAR